MSMESEIQGMNDAELLARTELLVRADRAGLAKLLVHLGEVDLRKLYREQAFDSMFDYCVEALRMSEAEAYLRIQAARVGREFPLVLERVQAGGIGLSAIKLIRPYLTAENHVALLDRVRGMRKRDVEKVVAEIAPQPDVAARIRKLPSRSTPAAPSSMPLLHADEAGPASQPPVVPRPTAAAEAFALRLSPPKAATKALSPGRFKLELTLSEELHNKLEQLRALLRHQIPDGDLVRVFELAVTSLLEKTMQRRFASKRAPSKERASVAQPCASDESLVAERAHTAPPKRPGRYVPRHVVREVHARDGGQCTFVSATGQRCRARGFLELHHHEPYARGGAATVENLRLTCRAHNALFAERDYGRRFMALRASRSSVQTLW